MKWPTLSFMNAAEFPGRAKPRRIKATIMQESLSDKMARKRSSESTQTASLESQPAGQDFKRPSGLTEAVYKRIRADIIGLRLPPNTRIFADTYARMLGVSQTPVREALSMLEAIGLVTKQHSMGYYTAPKFNREQYRRLFEIRRLLEPHAARVAAEKIDRQTLKQLSVLIDRMETETSVGSSTVESTGTSYEAFADQDSDFHALIAAAGNNILIAEALDRLHTHIHIFRIGVKSDFARQAKLEHMQIKKALESGDPDAAEKAMRAHIDNSFERLIPFMDE